MEYGKNDITKSVRIRKYDPSYQDRKLKNAKATFSDEKIGYVSKIYKRSDTLNNQKDINDCDFILDGDISFSIGSNFDSKFNTANPIMDKIKNSSPMKKISDNKFGQAVAPFVEDAFTMLPKNTGTELAYSFIYGGFDWAGHQVWKSTKPVNLTINILIDPDLDVESQKERLFILMSQCVPKKIGKSGLFSVPGPKFTQQIANMLNQVATDYGVSLDSANAYIDDKSIASDYSALTVLVGNLRFENMTLVEVKPIFNKEMDTTGFPISIRAELNFVSNQLITDETVLKLLGLDIDYNQLEDENSVYEDIKTNTLNENNIGNIVGN